MRPVVTAAVLLLLLSGCFADAPDTQGTVHLPDGATQTATPTNTSTAAPVANVAPPTDVRIATDGTDCAVVAAVLPVEPARIVGYLPPGYHYSDLGALLGAPAQTGKAGLGVANVQCADSRIGPALFVTWLVFVDPPAFDANLTGTMVDGFSLGWMAREGPYRDALDAVHIPSYASNGDIMHLLEGSSFFDGARSVSQMSAVWGDDNRSLIDITNSGAAPFDFPGDGFRAWTQVDNGTSIYEARLSIPVGAEQVTFSTGDSDCTFDADLEMAKVLGHRRCTKGEAIGLNVLDFDFVDTGFTYFHGKYA